MPDSASRGQPERRLRLAMRAAVIPGMLLSNHDFAAAKRDLQYLIHLAQTGKSHGLIPRSPADRHPDSLANLWFVRAAHYFAAGATEPEHVAFAAEMVLPMCKKIVQEFVASGGIEGVRMDDGGLLIASDSMHERVGNLRLNALWYSALEKTGQALRSAARRDHSGDHFERLAGRFRRSFAKAYWCDDHGRICAPEARATNDHSPLPDAEQLLLCSLPASPLPRTKQRQILANVTANALGEVGVHVAHETHGSVDSPLHRAWLIQGLLAAVEKEPNAVAEAARLIAPLLTLREQATSTGITPYFRNGAPLPRLRHDVFTYAEILGAIALLKAPL